MITKFVISNFKKLKIAELDLGRVSVLIGPNNSGKTTALQALALWDVGWRRWCEKRDLSSASKRPGVTINRRDLLAIPIPSAKYLWKDLHTHDSTHTKGKPKTDKIYITLEAEGVESDKPWKCSFDFYYANEESFYCRFKDQENQGKVPDGARRHQVVFLPPMSGLAEREYRKEKGEIGVLIGEGQTAQVLRNLCWQLFTEHSSEIWDNLCKNIHKLFMIRLNEPKYIKERSELTLTYIDESGVELDVSSSGRGCQQVLLLLAFLLANPGTILLLDEPDAHLEILRQRDVYNLISELAEQNDSQLIAASHSEIVLEEAAQRDVVIGFLGKPHRIDARATYQLRKSLQSIRVADYYLAEQKGWVLYLEGATDLRILQSLARKLNHKVSEKIMESVPVIYLGSNKPQDARDHFYGLCEARDNLVGLALFDRLDKNLNQSTALKEIMWKRREIENYVVSPDSLRQFIVADLAIYKDEDDLLIFGERERRLEIFESCLVEIQNALKLTFKPDPWGPDIKVTDDFLDPLFRQFYERLGTPQRIFKRDYHALADVISIDQIDHEVSEVLNLIDEIIERAVPSH
jgi:ABC-type multidrug transport system ATPase subunit